MNYTFITADWGVIQDRLLKVWDECNQLSRICRSPAVFYTLSKMKVHFKQWWQGNRRGGFLHRAAFSTSQGFEVCPHQFRFTYFLTVRVWSQQPPWLLNTPACICSNLQLWSKNRDNSHAHYSGAQTWVSDACTVNHTTHIIKLTQTNRTINVLTQQQITQAVRQRNTLPNCPGSDISIK